MARKYAKSLDLEVFGSIACIKLKIVVFLGGKESMMNLKQGFLAILSLGLVIILMGGCSAKSQTRVMSEQTGVDQPHESLQPSDGDMDAPKVASEGAEPDSASSINSPIEPSGHDEEQAQSIFATPQEGHGQSPDSFMAEETSGSGQNDSPGEPGGSLPGLELNEEPMEIAKLVPSEPDMSSDEGKEELLHTLKDVFFDYDRFRLRTDEFPELTTNADVLSSQLAGRTIVLEGHCDERGTESYNMILGKRRARAVKEYLVDLGIPSENLTVMSLGKEKPFCTESTSECWQENRRVHFVVR
ncbi:MAG: hypothetical protein NPIRA04_36550 [Nitrospirales bacterium]|nr:MAG: hypothetical protein NPIRA04_36550 [Nitrospirales bacterium]